MNDNEELLTTQAGALEQDVIDLDDVEGHGLREVAAGLGAAALLAGGASAAAVTLGVHPSLPGGTRAQVSAGIDDPIGTTDKMIDHGVATVRSDRDAALRLATREVGSAVDSVGHVAAGAEATAAAFVTATEQIAGQARQAVSGVEDTAFETANQAGSTAGRTAQSAATTAVTTADDTTADTARKAATVLQVVTSTASATTTTLEMTVSALNPQAGAGVGTQDMSGWMSIQVEGQTLAQVRVADGRATVTLDTSDLLGKTVSVIYSGDAVHASSTRSLAL